MDRIGFGGGCHWCTEAVFQTLKGVIKVEQGWIASNCTNDNYSEAVIVIFDQDAISLFDLIDVHLGTHSCTSSHPMREKYRSAIYTYNQTQFNLALNTLERLQSNFESPILTQVLEFVAFKKNQKKYQDYYLEDPTRPFCQRFIGPKISLLYKKYGKLISSRE